MFVGCCLMAVVWCLLLFGGHCTWGVLCRCFKLLVVVSCSLLVVRCLLSVVRCRLFVVGCMLCVVWLICVVR